MDWLSWILSLPFFKWLIRLLEQELYARNLQLVERNAALIKENTALVEENAALQKKLEQYESSQRFWEIHFTDPVTGIIKSRKDTHDYCPFCANCFPPVQIQVIKDQRCGVWFCTRCKQEYKDPTFILSNKKLG